METGSPLPDPFDEFFTQIQGRDSDTYDYGDDEPVSPAASNYSSCEDEGSELDRYCSANSALGSASLCSSVGNYGDLLDFVEVDRSLDKGGTASPRERGSSQLNHPLPLADRMESFSRNRNPSRFHTQNVEVEGHQEAVSRSEKVVDFLAQDAISLRYGDGCSDQSSLLCMTASTEEVGLLGNLGSSSHVEDKIMADADEGFSFRYANSDDEESMLEYGTDFDNTTGRREKRITQCVGEMQYHHTSPLLMNPSVAFGSNDLDEFLHENGGLGQDCFLINRDKMVGQQLVLPKSEKNVPSLAIKHVIESIDIMEETGQGVSDVNLNFRDSDQLNKNGRICPINNPLNEYEASQKGKPVQLEYVVEDQVNSCYKGVRDICSMNDGSIADIDVGDPAKEHISSKSAPSNHITAMDICSFTADPSQSKQCVAQEHDNAKFSKPIPLNDQNSIFQIELNSTSKIVDRKEEDIITNEVASDVYDEMVLEMEEILLDTGKSSGTRSMASDGYACYQSHHIRDGSSTASTSGTDDVYPSSQRTLNWVAVIGAKQRKGDVSFGERLVGVKEYTVYILKVWSANDQWEVERRYRDFFALYQQLRVLFSDHGLSLPTQWTFVERESMKIFGNASPIVVSKRSDLIQDCLRSILSSAYPFGFPNPLFYFLSPGKLTHKTSSLKSIVPRSLQKLGEDWNSKSSTYDDSPEDITELGKTIRLVVDLKPQKSMQQLLELQHYTCAGCHKHLDYGRTLLRELVQTLGWNKPRFCEYTGQLFCASCHANDTSVLPAKVLHRWDFSLYPVSQLAKAYLESIYDKPMLCVSAMNPFLFSKVPALLHVMGIRKKIAAMFPYIRCPFRISIHRGLGSRRHLLESNDFFALRDLVDLSKGAFAALPIMLETLSNKILEHIAQQCLVCYDTGVPCAARQVCDDPLSLIFPFQEAEAAKCKSCGSIFHKPCFIKIVICPCSKPSDTSRNLSIQGHGNTEKLSDVSVEPSYSSSASNLLPNIILKAASDKIWKPRNKSPVILMDSLPNTSL
ncbi:uncharacterized protein LOC121975901 [Zingiber officinale]|uniref:uncharacterized protein LOC121975901 n=1 Tax=Zingiber officinale TaxID=94328 RepID=UPI001C4DC68C|nr:uncharacterized protein LOC121975901 [Zingiber officinale]